MQRKLIISSKKHGLKTCRRQEKGFFAILQRVLSWCLTSSPIPLKQRVPRENIAKALRTNMTRPQILLILPGPKRLYKLMKISKV